MISRTQSNILTVTATLSFTGPNSPEIFPSTAVLDMNPMTVWLSTYCGAYIFSQSGPTCLSVDMERSVSRPAERKATTKY